ncbi:ArsR/SmtB family transcription factor [Schleiferilactobacillus shenzhenensis]|uniref:HTH arsR-type domain-containing protein n=1 Tax=Schleiferilactobacillus shenzhenensis LY-73 TaxID=1231336 RepID=U4THT0_9LACO|nr:ArsR family transcriptional regulator [Schleiferilactobacillus shenzhenensis]ERL63729.1 hypothetical protein L248_2226 [Schleiferilactobacillus shenzhenensis LY-73]
MEIELVKDSLPMIHALDSETRIDIVNLLAKRQRTITSLAETLHYSKAIISKHVKLLQEAGVIQEVATDTGDRRQKILAVKTDSILINLPEHVYPDFSRLDYDIPLGNYFANTNIEPTCGLANKDAVIGKVDDPNSFLSSDRMSASLLWFSQGSVEYIIPNEVQFNRIPELLDISFEISSEFPVSNNNWPSDISFWINDVKVGTWTVSGNYSDVRGKLTPAWWSSEFSQYGILKHLRVHKNDTGIDGEQISNVSFTDLGITDSSTLRFRIGIDPSSPHQGGLTLFGKDFGNYPQDIHVAFFYSNGVR